MLAMLPVLLVASSHLVSLLAASLVTPWNRPSHTWQWEPPVEAWLGGQRSGLGLSRVPLPGPGVGDKVPCGTDMGHGCLWMCCVGVRVLFHLSLLCVLQPHGGCQDHANTHTWLQPHCHLGHLGLVTLLVPVPTPVPHQFQTPKKQAYPLPQAPGHPFHRYQQ